MNKKFKVVFFVFWSIILQQSISAQNLRRDSKITAKDTLVVKQLNDLVVLASKTRQLLLHSPISIHKVNQNYFEQNAATSFYDALENVQSVQMITPSLGFKVINTRGFANTTNVRFSQMADGMDIQSPHIGAPIGNAMGPSDLDIKNVEIIPGVASTLYGMNSINGLANLESFNAFEKIGLSVQQKTGMNHLGDSNVTAKIFSETNLRYANTINNKWAYKFNIGFNKGYDWIADNKTELNPNANLSTGLLGSQNPAQDPVNVYGNESSDRKTIQLQGKSYVVSRTGYDEKAVANYNLQNVKGNVGIYYKPSELSMFSYTYHYAMMNDVYQRSNRFVLQDYMVQQHAIQYQSPILNFKLYTNNENSGNSYNLRSMAENIDRNYKLDAVWYTDYTNAFNKAYLAGSSVSRAHLSARSSADAGRYIPGTDAFGLIKQKLQQINNWDTGAALKVIARLVHTEVQIDILNAVKSSFKAKGMDLIVGADNRTYMITPDGNYFINPAKGISYNDIYYAKNGAYLSTNYSLLNNKLKLGASYRVDKNDYFKLTSNPRMSILYTPNTSQSFRIAYSEGYRFPSIFEAFSNINSGGVKRIGGLPVMSSGVYENAWLASSMITFQAAVLNDINKNGLTKTQAILKGKGILVKNTYGYLKPEFIKSYELGYRASYFQDQLILDLDFYYNHYQNFIAQTNVNVPKTNVIDSIPFALNDKTQYNQYRIWTNSKSMVYNYGISAGLTFKNKSQWLSSLNTTYSQLKMNKNDDGLEDGYNTPAWIINASVSKKNIIKHLGAGLSYKWQSAYYTQTFLVTGTTPSYGTLDAQISNWFPKYKINLKIGSTNLLNNYYYSYLGGPIVGGMYYLSITY